MSQKRAITILLLGLVVLLGSCVPLGGVVKQVFDPPLAAEIAVDPAGGLAGHAVEVDRDGLVRVVLQLDVSTPSVQENLDDDEPAYVGRYSLPVRLGVRGADGEVLLEQAATIDWRKASGELTHSVEQQAVDLGGGRLVVHYGFRRFGAPADGQLAIDLAIGPDQEYGATVDGYRVVVEHRLRDPVFAAVFGFGLMAIGVITTVIGFVFVVTGVAAASVSDVHGAPPTDDLAARRIAMACHLAGFAGYVLPFGNLAVPLVVWLVNRRRHPFVDEQGREALNFQLTVLVFSLLSLALALVVIGFLLLLLLALWHVVFMVVAAVRASDGRPYRYPMTIRFLR